MKISAKKEVSLNRRDFLKGTAALAGAGAVGPLAGPAYSATPQQSTVVLVRHNEVIDESGKINQEIINAMFKKGMTELTGKSTLSEAWKTVIPSTDRVSVKINAINLSGIRKSPLIEHFNGVAQAITNGLRSAENQGDILFWDRTEKEMVRTGIKPTENGQGKIRVIGTEMEEESQSPGYDSTIEKVGNKESHVSNILTNMTDSLINVSLLKNHMAGGITGCLKNHYGTVDNPASYHWNNCTDPGIPEINLIPSIRGKQKLCICDALLGVYSWGPYWRRAYIFKYGGLLFSQDPVAIDAVHLKILNEKRVKEKKDPISAENARHISISEKMGLGVADLNKIELKEFDLG